MIFVFITDYDFVQIIYPNTLDYDFGQMFNPNTTDYDFWPNFILILYTMIFGLISS